MQYYLIKNNIKVFVKNILNSKFIPGWCANQYELANHLRKIFDQCDIKTILDIGANQGQYAYFLRKYVKFKGTIISFEPNKELFSILQKKSKKDPKWHCYPVAFGEEAKVDTFNIMNNSLFSSFLKPKDGPLFPEANIVVDTHEINVFKLDDFWQILQETHDLSSVYLKLDTQGFDLKILRGAIEKLPEIKALQSELSVIPIYQDMPNFKEVGLFLENNNFAYSGIYPVGHDSNMRIVEFDGVFINSKFCTN